MQDFIAVESSQCIIADKCYTMHLPFKYVRSMFPENLQMATFGRPYF